MPIATQLRQMLRDLRTQKLRTFLTTAGIVWGTVAISLLLAFGEGLDRQLYVNFAGLGEYIVIAWPSRTSMPYEGLGKGRPVRLTLEDMALIRREVNDLGGVSGEFNTSMKLNRGRKTISVEVHGVEPVYGALRNMIPAAGGRWINTKDNDEKRRVAFIGDELATDVFGHMDVVGETMMLGGSPFRVVGVLKPKNQDSSYSGRDKDKVLIPSTTFRTMTGRKFVNNVIFKANSEKKTETVKDQVIEVIAAKYRFHPKDKGAFFMWDTTEQFQQFGVTMMIFKLFVGIVGALTLVVGGIGVSNIMNVVVEERTREIGIKMALGARSGQILRQLMLETLIITAVGGAFGIAIAIGICSLVPQFGMGEFIGDPTVSPQIAMITAALLGGIALLAGYFPARGAAGLDPVIAMKK